MGFKTGSKVWLDGPVKRFVTLGTLLKSGGAGSVYLIREEPSQVAKIYHDGQPMETYERKLKAMLSLTPNLPDINEAGKRFVQIAWPQAMLRDDRGRFAGFTMPSLDIKATSELEYIMQERQARAEGLPTGLGTKITLAANLSAVIAELHRQRHYVVDMKPVNLRFYRQSLYMAMLDCDGFSIQGQGERFEAPQFTPDYLAPEFQVKGIDIPGEEHQDRFALAVVIFQLLNFGIHPYTGKPLADHVPTDIPGRIAARCYAYGIRPHKAITPSMVSGHEAINSKLRHLFDRAFESTGLTRPSAGEWASALKQFAQKSTGSLVVCKTNKEHQHFLEHACAACARENLLKKAKQAPRHPPLAKKRHSVQKATTNMRSLGRPRVPTPTPGRKRPIVIAKPVSVRRSAPYPFQPYVPIYTPPVSSRRAILLWMFRNPGIFVIIFFGILAVFTGNSKHQDDSNYQEYYEEPRSSVSAETILLNQRVEEQRLQRLAAAEIAARNRNYQSENPVLPPPDLDETDTLINTAAQAMAAGNMDVGSKSLRSIDSSAATRDKPKVATPVQHKEAFGRYLSSSNNSSAGNIELRQAVLKAEFIEIISRDPVAAKTSDELAWLCLLTKDSIQARRYFTQAIWADPKMATAWYGLGMSWLSDSNVDEESIIGVFVVAEMLTEETHVVDKVNSKIDYIYYQHAPEEQARFARLQARARQIVEDQRQKEMPEGKAAAGR